MGFWKRLFGSVEANPAPQSHPSATPGPTDIKVYDAYGRELYITRDEWRTDIPTRWPERGTIPTIEVAHLETSAEGIALMPVTEDEVAGGFVLSGTPWEDTQVVALARGQGPAVGLAVNLHLDARLANVGYELATPHEELTVPLRVAAVNDGSAAEIAGVRQGDELLSLRGRQITSLEALLSTAGACRGCELIVQRGGQRVALTVEPLPSFPGSSQHVLGVVLGRRMMEHGWVEAIQRGTAGTFGLASAQVRGVFGIPPADVGPPGIPASLSNIVRPNPWRPLSMLSLVALMLAMLNMIPAPALAGGRLAALMLEAVMGRQLSARAERRVLWGVFMVTVIPVIGWLTWVDLSS